MSRPPDGDLEAPPESWPGWVDETRWELGRQRLTARQAAVFRLISECQQQRGYAPSLREMCRAMGLKAPNGVTCHLKALERKGLIRRDYRTARAIRLTVPATQIGPILRARAGAGSCA